MTVNPDIGTRGSARKTALEGCGVEGQVRGLQRMATRTSTASTS
jgi:hypothetical protein